MRVSVTRGEMMMMMMMMMKMMMMMMVVAVMVGAMLSVASAEELAEEEEEAVLCIDQEQCSDCIQTPGCVWCIKPKMGKANCQHGVTINMTSFCDHADLKDPPNEVTVVQNKPLTAAARDRTSATSEQPQEIIQVKPQKVKLRLREGVAQNVTITFRRALAYPVDLYYLMDLSNSMEDDKKHLANVSKALANTLEDLTDQYAIGFGSFVDKVMLPFTDTSTRMLKSPCENCSSPYSFRNNMKLTKNHDIFKTKVEEANISGNLDAPEGGFDALMQAMVCKEQIGWRDVARRILVFSTDDKFHTAGDGRLAGVVMPNDEECHLNEEGYYTAYDKFDYPSVSQINKVAKEKNINVIFAVLAYTELYEALSNEIETSSFGRLEKGSSNVVDLIRQQYQSISSEVILTDNSTEDITIVYSSACKGGTVQLTNNCDGIQENDQITFNLQITANACPADGKGSIVAVKTLEDTVILDLEFHCFCDCPNDPDTSKCNRRGRRVCGVCECDEGYSGDKCQCGGGVDAFGVIKDQNEQCMAKKNDSRLCSGRGDCVCGECVCRERNVTGKFCECDSRNCKQPGTNVTCSGRGKCDCNTCKCYSGYAGRYCQCPDDSVCIQAGSDKVCSGHGTCECGKCRCNSEGNNTHTGRYCEDCLRCGTGKCSQFRDCVQCVHFGNGPRKNDCNSCDKTELVESLDELMFAGARLCTFEDEDGCYVNFTYRYLEKQNKEEVVVQAERQCQEPASIFSIVFPLIGAIVAVGILTLLIWKIITTLHDRREFAKFEKERKEATFSSEENPLYIKAETTVQNPVFGGQH